MGGGQNAVSSDGAFGFIGGGQSNALTGDAGDSAIVGGYSNGVSGADSFIGSGSNNSVSGASAAIAGGDSNTASGSNSSIGGGKSNTITTAASYAAIGGGQTNNLSGAYGFLGAGTNNTLSAEYGVLVGGTNNAVSGEGAYIAAGGYNTASGEGAVVDGGFQSTAAGTFATVPGGYVNNAAGTYSFAAGARASAAQTGTFVWSDGSDGDTILTSSRAYQFLARASGGFTLYTNAGSTVGAQLGAGSGSWASLSDRNAKTAIVPVDGDAVLAKVDALPISRWSYKSEHGVRHVGPMAQDFYAAFKVGEDDRHITSIDEDGVALAAIKALNRSLRAQEQTSGEMIAQLRRELAAERAHGRRVDAELARIVTVLRK
ncbi:MAG TPA: tail fiber domain-containing protein [Candidatus Elarobacter sp.]|nr:tail fiber domain-containing protein [Candidatus Elarobacter sp.]